MRIDLIAPRRRTARRSPTVRLREQLLELACGRASVLTHEEKAWASVTFAGARHRVELAFEGAEAVEAGKASSPSCRSMNSSFPGCLSPTPR
jgi:hypothetical protein